MTDTASKASGHVRIPRGYPIDPRASEVLEQDGHRIRENSARGDVGRAVLAVLVTRGPSTLGWEQGWAGLTFTTTCRRGAMGWKNPCDRATYASELKNRFVPAHLARSLVGATVESLASRRCRSRAVDQSNPPATALDAAVPTVFAFEGLPRRGLHSWRMDKSKLLAALREETLPRMAAARAALRTAQKSGDATALTPVRELCHRVSGTAAMAGLPGIGRLGMVGETVAQLALDGDAKVVPRLCLALTHVLDSIEAELSEEKTDRMTSPVAPPAAPAPAVVDAGRGRVAVVSDEVVSSKLLARVLEDAGFEVTKFKLVELEVAPATDTVVLDVPSADGRLAQVEAILTLSLAARLPVLMTGKPDVEALKPLAARASQFLPKPVVPETLVASTRTLVARRRMAAAARSKAPTAQVPIPSRPGAYGAVGRALKVLIVDDSRVIRGVVREALAEVGLVSIEAEDGAEAVRIYDVEKPDAVISDVQMPGLDGAQLTRLLRERDPSRRIPIVVLSALDDDVSRQAGLAAGADAYLVKSVIDGPALLEALKRAGLPLS